jgi:cell division protein ZapA
MAQVEVSINGRSYMVACGEGQEAHVARLGRYIDQKVQTLVKVVGQVGDARLLLMASLLVADELNETGQALTMAKGELATAATDRERVRAETLTVPPRPAPDELVLARTLDTLAARIEAIAAAFEQD